MTDTVNIKFINACSSGDMNSFQNIFSSLSEESKNQLIAHGHYACFHVAAAKGHYEIVKSILNYVKSITDEMPAEEAVIPIFFARNGEGFKAALDNKHIDVVELIATEEFLFYECLNIISENPEYIKTIWNSSLKHYVLYIFDSFCRTDINLVKSILDIFPKSQQSLLLEYKSCNISPFETACASCKLDIMQFLWGMYSADFRNTLIEKHFSSCYIKATKAGCLGNIRKLYEWIKPQKKVMLLTSEDYAAVIYAADRGYLDIIQFIWKSLPCEQRLGALSASNYAAYRLATKNNHLNVVEFLEKNASDELLEKMKKAITQSVVPPKH